jgi:cell division control protein 7
MPILNSMQQKLKNSYCLFTEDSLEIAALRKSLPQLDTMLELHCKVGEGTFSSVYLATLRQNPNIRLAVKHLTPTCHPSRVKRELQCLRDIG